MAGIATTYWEIDPASGNALNGGGYDSAAGTTDYSQTSGGILSLSDLANSGAGVADVSSTMGGFTAAMVGNYLQIASGVNDDPGFYRITAVADTNNATLDRAPDTGAGAMTSAVCIVGGPFALLTDAFLEDTDAFIPGNTIWLKSSGTHSMASVGTARDGLTDGALTIAGYNATRGDTPTGDDRPLIALGSSSWITDNRWHYHNLRFTMTSSTGIAADNYTVFSNCKVENTSGTSNRDALKSNSGFIKSCEAVSTNGAALACTTGSLIESCYFHDSLTGVEIQGGSDYIAVVGCIFDTISGIGVSAAATSMLSHRVSQSTFYACGTAVKSTSAQSCWAITNCIMSGTAGVDIPTSSQSYLDHNCYNNSGTDVSGVNKGPNAVDSDPLMADPANGDFTISAASPCYNVGLGIGAAGSVGTYKKNIGADQTTYGGASAHQTRLETIC